MTDDVDPTISQALRRLAGAAPQPRADRLSAVVAGARHRRHVRATTSTLTAVVFVVAAAVGVHSWQTSADSTTGPRPATTGPTTSDRPDPAPSSPEPASSGALASAAASPVPNRAPAPNHTASSGLTVSVTVPSSVTVGEPAKAVMTVTNKGGATTHGGAFTFVSAYADSDTGSDVEYDGYSSGCKSTTTGVVCTVGMLKPGDSAQFWAAAASLKAARSLVFQIRWDYAAAGSATVSTPFVRVVAISEPPSSQEPPSSLPPGVSSSPTAATSS
jgi:hypothetical protein